MNVIAELFAMAAASSTEIKPADKIAIIGLGYVGLPLAVEFGKSRPVIGFDVNKQRIAALHQGQDDTREVSSDELAAAASLTLSADPADLADCRIFIVTVPTPIDGANRPDLTALLKASETVGNALSVGDYVIYESTVFPGATEDECVPVLEDRSGLALNQDFYAGYSPERINPGDKTHRLPDICKVTSGSTPAAADQIDALYASIITAGTHKAQSIKVAEAAKVIENTQRDLNIALVNELAIIFNLMDIDTEAVLAAAGTKWNFLPFRPGLVGGHCIGVDPYYLTHKAESLGYRPEIILAGRRLNDDMGAYVANGFVKSLLKSGGTAQAGRVLILGLTFKENCPDLRNTKVVSLIRELEDFGLTVDVWDPVADTVESDAEYGIQLTDAPALDAYDGIILAVGHTQFKDMGSKAIRAHGKPGHIFYDLKSLFPRDESDMRL